MSYKFMTSTLILFFAFIIASSNAFAQAEGPGESRGMRIEDHFIPSNQKKAGLIHALKGRIVVRHKKRDEAYFGKEGDTIYENDTLQTLAGSRCRVMLLNDDLITMAPDTRLSLDAFEDDRKGRTKTSLFSMLKGKAMFYALRLFRYKKLRFRVKTPTAVVGVRGTKFGAHVYWLEENQRADAGVRVADSGKAIGPYLAQVDPQAGKPVTVVAAGDGQVDVDGVLLNPGDVFNTLTRMRTFDPDQRTLNRIEAEAEVTSGEGAKEENGEKGTTQEEGEDETAALDSTGAENSPAAETDIVGHITEATQVQTINVLEDTAAETNIAQGKIKGKLGAIAAMITKDGATDKAIALPMYVTHHVNPFTGGAETYTAYEDGLVDNDKYKMIVNEVDEANTAARVDFFDAGTGNNLADGVSPKNTFTYFTGGTYLDSQGREYLQWGHWEDQSGDGRIAVDGSTDLYAANKKIWQIEGAMTHPDYIDYLETRNASYAYRGGANGVFADSSTAAEVRDLSGSFSCQVDFGTRSISQFDINVAGGGKTVHMYNGSGKIDANGTFDVQNFEGTIGGQNVQAPGTNAGGTFFGYKAEGIGGNWNAHDGVDLWATGEFHGKR